MTLEEVQEQVERIKAAAVDSERAHSMEDQLHQLVLHHHAERGCPLANAALETLSIDFSRWCA